MSNEEIGRNAAAQFRAEHFLGTAPISDLACLIEHKVGIGVAYVRSSVPGHGMTMRLGDMYLMAVGCTEHPMRPRSTLAHELGHHQLDSVDRIADGVDWSSRSPEEIQADAFARHLLVPMSGVADMVEGGKATLATLSDIVKTYLASPAIVAIQMRDAGVIHADTYNQWRQIAAGTIATQFGWRTDYQSLVEQSSKPRGPERIMMRAMEGYHQGSVTFSTIAKLSGDPKGADLKVAHDEDGFTSAWVPPTVASPPSDTGERLTPEELAAFMGDTE